MGRGSYTGGGTIIYKRSGSSSRKRKADESDMVFSRTDQRSETLKDNLIEEEAIKARRLAARASRKESKTAKITKLSSREAGSKKPKSPKKSFEVVQKTRAATSVSTTSGLGKKDSRPTRMILELPAKSKNFREGED